MVECEESSLVTDVMMIMQYELVSISYHWCMGRMTIITATT